jgi:hypothetical protein
MRKWSDEAATLKELDSTKLFKQPRVESPHCGNNIVLDETRGILSLVGHTHNN